MALPKSVRVAGYDVPVELEDSPDFTDEYHGQYLPLPCKVRLSRLNSEQRQRETLLHELLHAVDDAFELELEEHQVSLMSRGVYAMLRDNPKLVAYLTE